MASAFIIMKQVAIVGVGEKLQDLPILIDFENILSSV